MYKTIDYSQYTFLDFNQPLGLRMNPENRWVKLADIIPWDVFEKSMPESSKAKPATLQSRCAWLWVP